MSKRSVIDEIAAGIIKELEEGTAPFIQPWKTAPPSLPYNPVSGTQYRGINSMWLDSQSQGDPRWMTYKQAQSVDAQVRRGEKSTGIVFWKFHEQLTVRGPDGKPKKDENGQTITVKGEKLKKPLMLTARVFNAAQIDHLPPLPVLNMKPFESIERAEALLRDSGASIHHGSVEGAYYNPLSDNIHLPKREDFVNEGLYYSTALHELGHWTGHSSRLDREMGGGTGSEPYAQEELRAEIYSYMMSAELRLPHDPSQHIAYISSWIGAIKEDPMTIHRAARDSGKILDYVQGLVLEQKQEQQQSVGGESSAQANRQIAAPSFTQRREIPTVKIDPEVEFTQAVKDMGLVVDGTAIMDGHMHRVPVMRDGSFKPGKKDGSYVGHIDGRPAGYIKNHYTGEERKWKAVGELSFSDKREIQNQVKKHRAERLATREKRYQQTGEAARNHLASIAPAPADHPYLVDKAIAPSARLMIDKKANLVVPIHDVQGSISGYQNIGPNGFKQMAKGMKKQGNMHLLGSPKDADSILVCEGYATGQSLHESTGLPVAVAFDAGNLSAVARAVQEAYVQASMFIMGDEDRSKDQNIGRIKAEEAARAVGGRAIFPASDKDSKKSVDFNDMAQSKGKAAVKAVVEAGIAKGKAREDRQLEVRDSPKIGMKV